MTWTLQFCIGLCVNVSRLVVRVNSVPVITITALNTAYTSAKAADSVKLLL